jgi:hypothetical protein
VGEEGKPKASLTGRLGSRWTITHLIREALKERSASGYSRPTPSPLPTMSTIKPVATPSPQLPIARDAEPVGSHKPKPKKRHPLLALSAGCVAGGIEATAVWPMEYIKVRSATLMTFSDSIRMVRRIFGTHDGVSLPYFVCIPQSNAPYLLDSAAAPNQGQGGATPVHWNDLGPSVHR